MILMHELSLAEDIFLLLEDMQRTESFSRLIRLEIERGQLSCVVPESLLFYLESVFKNSFAEGAEICIREADGRAQCQNCLHQFVIYEFMESCPKCQSYKKRILTGKQLQVKAIEVS